VTGDFSGVVKNGFLIEGDDRRPIRETMIAGNLFETLKRIESVSADRRLLGGTALLPSIRVGGRSSKAQYQYTLQSIDLKALYDWSDKVTRAFAKLPGFEDVTTDLDLNSPSISVKVDRDRLAPLGLSMAQVQSALGAAFGANQISTIYGSATQYWVILQVQRKLQSDPDVLSQLYLTASNGTLVPLDAVATFRREPQVLTVNHQGQLPAVTVSFNLAPGVSLSSAVSSIDAAMATIQLPATISGSIQGTAQAFEDSTRGMGLLLLLAVFVIYLVLGILYESFIHPLTILSGLPAAAVGALLTLVLFDASLDLFAFVGIVMLIGIVKKNAIMLIDFALERQRDEGMIPAEAIFEACRVRFRPIMMTTMAALAGTLPIALGIGAGIEVLHIKNAAFKIGTHLGVHCLETRRRDRLVNRTPPDIVSA